MYAWLFYLIPGPKWFKWLFTLVVIAAVVLVLMEVVFPWLSEFNFFSDATMDVEE